MSDDSFATDHYYVRDRGHVQGPFDLAELRRRIIARRITRQNQVSTDKVTWHRISELLPELFPVASGPRLDPPKPVGQPITLAEPAELEIDVYRPGDVIDDDFGTPPRPANGGRSVAIAVAILAVTAPLAVVGLLAMLILSPSTGDRAVADRLRPSIVHIQGIHPEHGKKRCLGLIVSRSLCIAPLMAATLDGVKIEARHSDGHAEWHSSRLQTADPVTGLCVLRGDFGSDVEVIDVPEKNRLPERRAALRMLTPNEDASCNVEDGTLKKVLNDGGPDEMLQIAPDDSDDDDAPLGRAVVDDNGRLAGMVVGRLPSGESLCIPARELRSKKKEAGKLPADHKLDRLDLPITAFPPGGAPGGTQGAFPPEAAPHPPQQQPGNSPETASEPGVNRPPAAAGADSAPAGDAMPRAGKRDGSGPSSPDPSAPLQRRADSNDTGRKKRDGGLGLPSVLRTATGLVNDAAESVVPLPELPPDMAKELGEEQLAEICRQHRRTRDLALQRHIRRIADDVLLAADRRPADYTVTVVEDSDVQAFAFVGRNVVVNTGFVDFAAGDDEMIRFVLSHEIGHIVLGHVDMPFRRNLMSGALVPGVPLVGEQINAAIKNSPFNQVEEQDADCFAVDLHRKKRWPIKGGVRFFEKIRDTQEGSEGDDALQGVIDAMFSSHPDHESRIDLLNNGCDG